MQRTESDLKEARNHLFVCEWELPLFASSVQGSLLTGKSASTSADFTTSATTRSRHNNIFVTLPSHAENPESTAVFDWIIATIARQTQHS
jgi:hypothetical protein